MAHPAHPPHAPAYSGPALTEPNLPAYDKEELVSERALLEKLKACKEQATLAKDQIDKFNVDKKALDKNAPDYKKAAKEIDQKIKALKGTANKKCKVSHPGCVPSDSTKKIPLPKEITDGINKKNNTKVDFSKLSAWEGGAFSQGYIPWWPYLNRDGLPKIEAKANSLGTIGPRIKGELSGKPDNKSGTTVGVGVDLGQYTPSGFFRILDSTNKSNKMLTPDQLDALKEKIKPYFNKWGGEACKFLHDNPLALSAEEINFLNAAAHEEGLNNAVTKYEDMAQVQKKRGKLTAPESFSDLTVEQQTALISNGYQFGRPKNDLVNAILNNNRNLIPKTREHDYLFNSMAEPPKK